MAQFKKTIARKIPRHENELTTDNLHWRKYKFPITIKEHGPITDISFSQVKPYHFAITSAAKVQVFNPATNKIYKNLHRFQEAAYGGTLRSDGKLLVAGGDEGQMRLFDVDAKSMLRVFKGHNASIHKCNFLADNKHTVSFSDDKTVVVWDVASEQQMATFNEHQDYVRAGSVSQLNHDLILSGSYDHTVKLFDMRTQKSILSLNHGDPVESVILFPSGFVIATAGGTSVKLWDVMGTGKLLANLSNHHKTVTCLSLASENQRLLSGSLDKHVKIVDVTNFKVVHTLDYPSPVLSLGVSPEDKTIVTGMSDGLFSIQHQEKKEMKQVKDNFKNPYEKYLKKGHEAMESDIVVEKESKTKLAKHDRFLKSYEVSKALDSVLKGYLQTNQPHVTLSVIQELIRRGSLKAALAGRKNETLMPVLRFVVRNLPDARFTRVLLDVAFMLLDIYGSELGDSEELAAMFTKMKEVAEKEIYYMQDLMKLEGVVDAVLAASTLSQSV